MVNRQNNSRYSCAAMIGAVSLGLALGVVSPASAQGVRIENTTAIFSALDKVTARISEIKVKLDETVEFGSLRITPRVCYSRPATELPKTSTFVEIRDTELDGQEKKIFSGWMFAESPALNAVEHPVFDVWLSGCEGGAKPEAGQTASQAETGRRPERRRRRRVRR